MTRALSYTVSEARNNFGDVLNRVAYTEQPAVITKHGSQRVAIVPYRLLELLTRLEAVIDLQKAEKALNEFEANGGICLDDLKKELGIE